MVVTMLYWFGIVIFIALMVAAVIWRRFASALTSIAAILAALLLMNWLADNGYWPDDIAGPPRPRPMTPIGGDGVR